MSLGYEGWAAQGRDLITRALEAPAVLNLVLLGHLR